MAFPDDPLDATVELAIGADIHADPGTWSWTDVTTSIREKQKVAISRGRRNRIGNFPPARVQATADNTSGDLCRHNPFSQYFGLLKKNTPMRISVDNGSGPATRAAVYVPGFPPSWDPSGRDQVVTLQGVGITDRLGRSKPLRSAPARYLAGLTGTVPVGAWLLEDGALVTSAAPIYGTEAMRPFVGVHPSGAVISHPQWGSGTLAPWLPSVVNQSSSSGLSAIWAPVSMPGFAGTWTVDHAYTGTTDSPVRVVDVNPGYFGGAVGWPQLTLDPANSQVSVSFDGSPETTTDAPDLFDGRVHHVRWTAAQNGANVDWEVYVDSTLVNSGTEATYTLQTIWWLSFVCEAGSSASAIGYASVWATAEPVADYTAAIMGHSGELAHERVQRLCTEERVPVTVTASTSQAMGAQGTGRLLDLLRDCAVADQGILFENMDFGLTYVASSERYNQPAAMTLAYDDGEILAPWEPTDDDQDYFNTIASSRPNGASYTVADDDEPDEVGVFADQIRPPVATDAQARHVAGWRLRLGLNDELTWPGVRPNLVNGGSLLDDWLATDLGQVLHITGHPAPLAPATIEQIIEGYTETIGAYTYDVVANLSPAAPWKVGVWDTARWGALWSRLAAPVDDTDTSWSVETDAGKWPWVDGNSGPEFPLYIEVGGLVYEVTEIAGTSSPQTFTVTRLAHDKAHDAGTPVTVHEPLIWALPTS